MNKVMTRSQLRPGTRPPGRRDSRRPGGTPPRTPAGGTPRATSASTAASVTAAPSRPPRPAAQLHPTDHIAELLVLVLSGQRPVHSMLRHAVGRAYDELADLAERGPLRARGTRPTVRDIGYYAPRPGAFEAFARIGAGDQLRAMAFRVEQGRDRRWRCTAVELGGSRDRRANDD
ncbi:hypothetical protein DI272_29800 [Streptomyces sp. Act143]|uniref:Rv3235 family protein n=1 Tax=Streptomyces sp. Act143 TaxID=2200760 RepID=UPI000D6806AE|nr:Rv3235 family protein [Streptomyces sp. Act143]PWI17889.1 hypothetical protein DI272_29800 [Streptomyces sp. Act143]